MGEYGIGNLANSLTLGCDCLGQIYYFDAVVNDSRGAAVTIANAVCLHEEDFGILWKHVKHADKAARALRFTSKDLLELGVVDEIIPEPLGAAHRDHRQMASTLKSALAKNLKRLGTIAIDELLEQRYAKFRRMGVFEEGGVVEA